MLACDRAALLPALHPNPLPKCCLLLLPAPPAPAGQLADELVAREFAAPQRPRPCQGEADECVRCYADNAADPLACGPAVEAYSACAKAAWQEALQRAV